MNRSLLALILLVGSCAPLIAKPGHSSDQERCKTCEPTMISKPTTITKPGTYCLTHDILGQITIESNDVVLDLNSHLIDGNETSYAIYSRGYNNITVKNGAVKNPGYSQFFSVARGGVGFVGMAIVDADGFVLDNVQIYECNNAFILGNSRNAKINKLNAYNNLNNAGAVVLIDNCDNVELFDVEVSHNDKATSLAGTQFGGGPKNFTMGILAINQSRDVLLSDCRVNHNVRTDIGFFLRFAPIGAFFSTNIRFINCQANGNSTIETIVDNRGCAAFYVASCNDVVMDSCQANENSVAKSQTYLRGIYVFDSTNNVITNCQANNNSVGEFLPIGTGNDLTGIFLQAAGAPQSNSVISHCQACGNEVVNGGAGRAASNDLGQVNGILIRGISDTTGFSNRTVIADCQTNENIMQTSAVRQTASGITILAANDVVVDNCTSNGNRGGRAAYGVNILGFPTSAATLPCRRIIVSHCTANDIRSVDLAVGFFLGGKVTGTRRSFSEDCSLIDCQAHRSTATNGCGILLQNTRGCTIIDSQVNQNSTTGFFAGIATGDPAADSTPINRNNTVSNSSAKENGVNGFEIADGVGVVNDVFLLESNVAVANIGTGFLHSPGTLTSTFLSNYAQDNGTNYSIAVGTIQVFRLAVTSGVYTYISGTNNLTSLTNIEAQ